MKQQADLFLSDSYDSSFVARCYGHVRSGTGWHAYSHRPILMGTTTRRRNDGVGGLVEKSHKELVGKKTTLGDTHITKSSQENEQNRPRNRTCDTKGHCNNPQVVTAGMAHIKLTLNGGAHENRLETDTQGRRAKAPLRQSHTNLIRSALSLQRPVLVGQPEQADSNQPDRQSAIHPFLENENSE